MHRRATLQLSRRHGVDWSCATARRDTAFAPVVSRVPRRHFRSSLPSLDSSGSSSSGPGKPAPAPSPPRPKFGSRWGTKAQQPVGLSPAEQAIRDALVEKQNRETERENQRKAQEQALQERMTQTQQRQKRSRPSRPRFSLAGNERYAFERPDSFGNEKSLQPDKSLEINSRRQKWATGWTCPDCQTPCFRNHYFCPNCKAPRPKTETPRYQRSVETEDAIRIRKLGSSLLAEVEGREDKSPSLRELAFRDHMSQKGEHDGVRRTSRNRSAAWGNRSATWGAAEPGREREPRRAEKAMEEQETPNMEEKRQKQKKADSADPWAWDESSLGDLDLEQEEVTQDRPKRRDIRKQREVEYDEEDGFDEDEEGNRKARREERKRQKKEKARRKLMEPSPLYLPEFISVSNLADVIGVRPAQFVARMEKMGFEDVTYDHVLDAEMAGLIASEYNYEPIFDTGDEDLIAAVEPEDKSNLPLRPPVVTIMGHVDHGKTTILDWLRKSSVAASEHGGITQHIGAFSVAMPSGKTITFLDTPGHAAFLEMRRRGADVTDIVVLVVAADDSVKPQTIEAIKHATSANVPIIVAMSKIDKEGVNPDRVKQDLSVHGVHVEDFGGDVQAIGVSGKTGQGMLELEEAIVTLSEVLDHRADPTGTVEGWVVEGTTKSYGRVATVLVRRGTLRQGDIVVAGNTWARVRTLRNEAGVAVSEATPGMPVEIDGWREQPEAGTELLQAVDEQQAKDVVEYRLEKTETQKLSEDMVAINEARREQQEKRRLEQAGEEQAKEPEQAGPTPVHFIIKADVGGSAEAVMNSVAAVGNHEVYPNVLRSDVGPVSEFDIEHAATAGGHVISFNMPIDPAMSRMAQMRGVNIMDHNVIYKLIDDVKDILSELLPPSVTIRVTGEAEVGQIFEISLKGREKTSIAGCKVRNGMINRAKKVRVLRGQEIIYDGSITSLKNVKKDVTEMRKDTECGIGFEEWTAFAVGDHIQCYEEIFEKRHL
ncbi:elongation factor Tu [Aspergillus ellipticus CBS 707.79]|uniref:Translation initiation factor IF-2, mitochondrial n=1 Tax=Aspergillus ellipticus CBS 707.79 TaxID=1448320 RepID=A0A319DNM2_9EURO|nr:elongation factor Tu [Aspergillus ellipticus CBS 707.79]